MGTVTAAGGWPGRAEGRVVWLAERRPEPAPGPVADRLAEVRRFRLELSRAVADLEAWSEGQPVLEGRLLLQGYRDALQEDAWIQRVCAEVDGSGLSAAEAAVAAADRVCAVMARREALQEKAGFLSTAARWIARRLSPAALPEDAVLAAAELSPLEILDRRHPALIAGPEPPVRGGGPLLWGVPRLGPDWQGKRVAADGLTVTVDESDPRLWEWQGERLNGLPIYRLNGDPEAVQAALRRGGERPVAWVSRLDDLAAVGLFAAATAGVVVDLDRLAPGPRLRHPGVRLLLEAAVAAAREAGVPLVAGGEPVRRSPAEWYAMGVSGIVHQDPPRGGRRSSGRRGARGRESDRSSVRGDAT